MSGLDVVIGSVAELAVVGAGVKMVESAVDDKKQNKKKEKRMQKARAVAKKEVLEWNSESGSRTVARSETVSKARRGSGGSQTSSAKKRLTSTGGSAKKRSKKQKKRKGRKTNVLGTKSKNLGEELFGRSEGGPGLI